jgi:hypothetical protein
MATPHGASPGGSPGRIRLKLRHRNWFNPCRPEQLLTHAHPMTSEQLLEARIEWLPPAPRCADCGHLGGLVTITDRRQSRRVRRICLQQPLGHTDSNWTACPRFERRGG